MSRRRVGLTFVSIALAATLGLPVALPPSVGANSACIDFCLDTFGAGSAAARCIVDAARGGGLCFTCGPERPDGETQDLCCVENANGRCAAYEDTTCCSGGLECNGGACCCEGYTSCGGECVPLRVDVENCGACGNVCEPDEVCFEGECWVPRECPVPHCFGWGVCDLRIGQCDCRAEGASGDDCGTFICPGGVCSDEPVCDEFGECEIPDHSCENNGLYCSGVGICDAATKECVCPPEYSGDACQTFHPTCP